MNQANHIYPACLTVQQLRLSVKLGRWEGERANPQPVELTIKFFFKTLPEACHDDDADLFCYDELAKKLSAYVEGKSFKVIEFMGMQLFEVVKENLRNQMGESYCDAVNIWLKLHKCNPPIPYLIGGSCFTYTDLPEGLLFVS